MGGRLRACIPWAIAVAIAALLWASKAPAYCRTSACGDGVEGTRCEPPSPDDCGTAIYWGRNCIGFAVQEDGSPRNQIAAEDAQIMLRAAFEEWMQADCGGSRPSVRVQDLGRVVCDDVEYNQEEGNANVLVFRDEFWPHQDKLNALALTTVHYDVESGEIYDADIEINGTENLGPESGAVWYDLQGVLTHEAGHALGLAHSLEPDAVMEAVIGPTDTAFRELYPDDVSAVCAVYPPGQEVPSSCNPIPRHGFSDECRGDQLHGTCAIGRRDIDSAWLLSMVLVFGAWRRRARCL